MEEDETGEDEDEDENVEMDFGEETGSDDTSNTDEEEEDILEGGGREPEEGWQDEDEDDDDDDDNEDGEEGDDGILWQIKSSGFLLKKYTNLRKHLPRTSMPIVILLTQLGRTKMKMVRWLFDNGILHINDATPYCC